MNILTKIKKAGLVGRGGAGFPTAIKWEAVKKAKQASKYVICNAAEGEPGVAKDSYILEKFADRVVDGIKIAIGFLPAQKAYIYINYKYHKNFFRKLSAIIGDQPIGFFIKPIDSGYIGGEETSILNVITGQRIEPRLRPPFPFASGLWGCPTLINNVETLYNVSLVNSGEYKKERFYTIGGDCLWPGVFSYPENWTIEEILKETKNYPNFSFFVQAGGDASGEILSHKQLKKTVGGAGSITVYSDLKYKSGDLIKGWLDFFVSESCGKCTSCREGVYRLREIVSAPNPDWGLFLELLDNLEINSFCGLGEAVPTPIKSYIINILTKSLADNKNIFKNLNKGFLAGVLNSPRITN